MVRRGVVDQKVKEGVNQVEPECVSVCVWHMQLENLVVLLLWTFLCSPFISFLCLLATTSLRK